ncbi:hypothetical protein [Enterococcus hermanniensis]|uniref:Uncharacterized protein n=1 Tax=Enterococcus hermanniensis TaxID=249189 RepID=A0A1L8TD08_9ENTE|nr:hypothetical protein [Enterococcus hermanniensis]OJG42190.1 hypothetical protein RV04_GL000797 [Enterococcus hermanniensis]
MFWNKEDEHDQCSVRMILYKADHIESTTFEGSDLSFIRDKDIRIPIRLSSEDSYYWAASSINGLEESGYNVTVLVDNEIRYCTRPSNLKAKQEPNLLEIKLKDTDSAPEVWYKGERLGEYPECLVDISYHWNTGGTNDNGANDINIEYYSTPDDKYLDKKIIGHKRDA